MKSMHHSIFIIHSNIFLFRRLSHIRLQLVRGIRTHFVKFVKPLAKGALEQSQLGLGHAYSRSKVIKRFAIPNSLLDFFWAFDGGVNLVLHIF